jgi:hypothetical protein
LAKTKKGVKMNNIQNYGMVNYQPKFKATLKMPNKAAFEKYAGKYCAEQAEIARPTIEKIAREAIETESISVYPRMMPRNWPQPAESITIGAVSKNGNSFGWPNVTPSDANAGESFADCIIGTVKDVIEYAKSGDVLT